MDISAGALKEVEIYGTIGDGGRKARQSVHWVQEPEDQAEGGTMGPITVLRGREAQVISEDWGELTWFASKALGNSTELTVGRCVIRPGRANPVHSHPNCSEVLVVLQGRITHTLTAGRDVELQEGDTITIPRGIAHQAHNTGEKDAVLLIAFSSADRKTEGE
jgi:quercetin dioxygenase-like cupin family protein